MAIIATVNVIYSKMFSKSIPSASDYITYFLVPVVYLSVAHALLDKGLVVADVLSRKFPRLVVLIINSISYVVGAVAGVFIASRQYSLMLEYIAIRKRSSINRLNFPLWPFSFILGVGMLLMTFGFIWVIIRDWSGATKSEVGKNNDPQLKEGGDPR